MISVLNILRIILVFPLLIVLTLIILISGYLWKAPLKVMQKALHNHFADKVARDLAMGHIKADFRDVQGIYIFTDWLSWAMIFGPIFIQNLCIGAFIFLVPGKKSKYKDLLHAI